MGLLSSQRSLTIAQMSSDHDPSDHPALSPLLNRAAERRERLRRFEANLHERWGIALDLSAHLYLEALHLGTLAAESLPKDHADEPFPSVLVRLHARACMVHSEIQALLASGHAAGANARWRTLHELQVVMLLLAEGGRESARRYLAHDAIESHRKACDYNLHAQALGYEPIEGAVMEALEKRRQRVEAEFGPDLRAQYGWAGDLVGNRRPKFHHLQAHVALAHYAPNYALASYSVHAQPKAVLWQYGSIAGGEDVVLAGPSNAGLAEPIHHSALVLVDVTELVCEVANVEIERARSMSALLGPLGDLVSAIEDELQQEERERMRAGSADTTPGDEAK